MADRITDVLVIWICCLFCFTSCWDLKPLEPISCPETKSDDGLCYEMVQQQVQCIKLLIGHCEDMMTPSLRVISRSNGYCMATSLGECTRYSCQTQCCDEMNDGFRNSCNSPYCDKECKNGGTCLRSVDNDVIEDKCNCPSPYYGEFCEQVHCPDECENGGTCIIDGSSTTCLCKEGFYGKTCRDLETDLPMSCPKPNKTSCCGRHGHCRDECWVNSDCRHDKLCCNDGCCTRCMRPVQCYYNGKQYRSGDVITDGCKECRCLAPGEIECSKFFCPSITCKDGALPVKQDGFCCPECPNDGTHTPPRFRNCKNEETKILSVKIYTSVGYLSDLGIEAFDYEGKNLQVTYSPQDYIGHCLCPNIDRPKQYVTAHAQDDRGDTSICGFWVIIVDPYRPEYNSCPADIFAQEGETIEWNAPRSNDYVGIQYASCDRKSGEVLPVGRYTVTCTATDYDDNKGYCQFLIVVDYADGGTIPPGLSSRQKKEYSTVYIIASSFSAVFLIVLLVFVCCIIYQRRKASNGRRQRGHRRGQPPPIHTISNPGLYSECGIPAGVNLPPYSPKIEPPTYDDILSHDDDTMPPTYQDATEDGAVVDTSGCGYLNAAYDTTAHVARQAPPTNEEDVYEEIADLVRPPFSF